MCFISASPGYVDLYEVGVERISDSVLHVLHTEG